MNKLTYWAARGTCDQVRLLLAETAVKYEEVIITKENVALLLQNPIPFELLPIWEEENLKIYGANCIMRHIARKTGLYGTAVRENALCDMWEQEILQRLWNADFMEESGLKQEQLKDEYSSSTLVPQLKRICNLMSANDGVFLVGDKISFVDLKLFAVLEAINKELPLVVPCFPLLAAYHKLMGTQQWSLLTTSGERPRVKELNESGRRY